MKKNIKYFVMATVALLSMSGCTNELDEQSTGGGKELKPVQFNMSMTNTRTATDAATRVTSWKVGDAIGIFAVPAGDTDLTNAKATNAKYILGANDTWEAEAGSEIYPEIALDYYAYYPYQADITDPKTINVSALLDQSTANGDSYGASDVLAGQTKNIAAGQGKVTIAFKHMFAMVEVKVQGDKVTKQPTKVELKGVKLDATLDLMAAAPAATVKADAVAQDITMYYLARPGDAIAQVKPFSFRAVIPAQEIAANNPLVAIYAPDDANKTYTMQHTVGVPYNAGVFRQLNVNIGTAKVSLTIPAGDLTIDPWTPSEPIDGEGGEVVTPVDTYTITFGSAEDVNTWTNYGQWKMTAGTYAPNNDTEYFFRRENQQTPAEFLTKVKMENNQLVLTRSDKPTAWMGSATGYHCTAAFNPGNIYKITISAESSPAGGSIGIVVTNNEDNKPFVLSNTDIFTTKMVARSATVSTNLVVYIDFSKYATVQNSSSLTNEQIVNVTDKIINHINVYLYNYNRTDNTSLDVKVNSVKIEKYTLP